MLSGPDLRPPEAEAEAWECPLDQGTRDSKSAPMLDVTPTCPGKQALSEDFSFKPWEFINVQPL
jgi:hypothetical protein